MPAKKPMAHPMSPVGTKCVCKECGNSDDGGAGQAALGVEGAMGVPPDEPAGETPSLGAVAAVSEGGRGSTYGTDGSVGETSLRRRINMLESVREELMVVEVSRPCEPEVHMAEVPKYLTLTVVLDSGAGAHVMNHKECPGYKVRESAMSKMGATLKAANGSTIRHHGQVQLNIVAKDSNGEKHRITSNFEAADVTRALWSVGLICDCGLVANFNAERAQITDQSGKEVCVFPRVNGGLYMAEVEIMNPIHADFPGQGA